MELGGTRHCVLILLLIYQIRTLQGQCAVNFPSKDVFVTPSAETPDDTVNTHLLFPSINFTCSARVTGWIMAAQATGRNNLEFPEIQTWRIQNLIVQQYRRLTTTANTAVTVMLVSPGLYKYTYSTPIKVSAGDVLALRIPPEDSTDIRPLFNTFSTRTFDKYIINPYDPSLELIPLLAPTFGDMYYPLIAPILKVSSSSSESLSTTMVSISTSIVSIPIATNTPTITTTLSTNPSSTVSSSVTSNPPLMAISSSTTSTITTRQPSLPVQTQPASSLSSSISILSSTVFPSVVGSIDSDSLPVSIVAGITIAVLLFVVIIIILVVVLLVILVLFNKRNKGKVEISSPPPSGYIGEEIHSTSLTAFDFEANVSYGHVNHHYMTVSPGGGRVTSDANIYEKEQNTQQATVNDTINVELNASYGHANHHYMLASPGGPRKITDDNVIYDYGIVGNKVYNDRHIYDHAY